MVHTAWGPSERWEELGANDAHAVHSLVGGMSRQGPSRNYQGLDASCFLCAYAEPVSR